MSAAQNGHEQVARVLLEAKANVEAALPSGHTSLMVAAQNGHEQVVRILIEAGANIEVKINLGHTALMLATKNHREQVVRTLLEAGADVNATSIDGMTARDMALGFCQWSVLLTKKKALSIRAAYLLRHWRIPSPHMRRLLDRSHRGASVREKGASAIALRTKRIWRKKVVVRGRSCGGWKRMQDWG